jgi:hypothetical protein
MTTNDIPLTECSRTVHKVEAVIDRLTRDSQLDELRGQYKQLMLASFKALERLDELERA